MRLSGSIIEAPRLLPPPRERSVAAGLTTEAVRPATPAVRPVVWTLSRETAGAAVAAQMLFVPKRGLKADAAERARFARAYAARLLPQAGLIGDSLA